MIHPDPRDRCAASGARFGNYLRFCEARPGRPTGGERQQACGRHVKHDLDLGEESEAEKQTRQREQGTVPAATPSVPEDGDDRHRDAPQDHRVELAAHHRRVIEKRRPTPEDNQHQEPRERRRPCQADNRGPTEKDNRHGDNRRMAAEIIGELSHAVEW